MKTNKKNFKKVNRKVIFYVIDQDMSSEMWIDSVAMSVMECLEGRVSNELMVLLKDMLLGFSEDMQLEIADNLLDFVTRQVIHTTGCISADAVLNSCYQWIAAEKGVTIVRG